VPTATPFWKNPVIVVVIACMVVFLAVMVFTPKGGGGIRGAEVKSMTNARNIGLACRQYAREHGGVYPVSLDLIIPQYMPDRTKLVSPLDPSEPVGYTFTPPTPARTDSPDTIVLEDKFAPTLGHNRVVVYANGSARILDGQ